MTTFLFGLRILPFGINGYFSRLRRDASSANPAKSLSLNQWPESRRASEQLIDSGDISCGMQTTSPIFMMLKSNLRYPPG